jgi:hypothetical protein
VGDGLGAGGSIAASMAGRGGTPCTMCMAGTTCGGHARPTAAAAAAAMAGETMLAMLRGGRGLANPSGIGVDGGGGATLTATGLGAGRGGAGSFRGTVTTGLSSGMGKPASSASSSESFVSTASSPMSRPYAALADRKKSRGTRTPSTRPRRQTMRDHSAACRHMHHRRGRREQGGGSQ